MHCPHCGVTLPSDARFCAGCGQALPGARGPVPSGAKVWIIAVVVAAVAAVPIIGIIAAIAIPNLLTAIDRSKQKRTMSDMRSIAVALDAYAKDHHEYPVAASVADLRAPLTPAYITTLPALDGWGKPFQVSTKSDGYELVSFGKDGSAQGCDEGRTTSFAADICFADGQFTQWPEAIQN